MSARQGFDPILLDLDGTVIDSVALIRESHRHAVREVLGEDWPDDRLVANVGPAAAGADAGLRAASAPTSSTGSTASGTTPTPRRCCWPTRAWRRRCASCGTPAGASGIVTSKSHDAVDLAWGVLPHLGELFDVVIAAEDTARHKPDAAPVLEALARLGARPRGACYVGDAPFDIQAGRAAGVVTIAVTWGFFTLPDLEAEGPDRVVATPEELAVGLPRAVAE